MRRTIIHVLTDDNEREIRAMLRDVVRSVQDMGLVVTIEEQDYDQDNTDRVDG